MAKQFLDLTGLNTFLTQLKETFATPEAVAQIENDTNAYVLDIDYTQIAFNTRELITEEVAQ